MSRFSGKSTEALHARLPEGESIIWQGKPSWRALAAHGFHVKAVTVYFSLLIVWRVLMSLTMGHGLTYALNSAVSCIVLGVAGVALFMLFAWAIARSSSYTITQNRVVITHGMALPKSLNLPFSAIDAASFTTFKDGSGDIAFTLPPKKNLAYLLLWPHVRAGRTTKSEPMFRCIAEPEAVAKVLANALAQNVKNVTSRPVAEPNMMAQAA